MEKDLVLFDGICNLCNTSVRFIIRHDKKDHFLFTSLQSDTANKQKSLPNFPKADSIILLSKGKYYSKSTAALRIASKLKFPINILSVLLVVPSILRNLVYDYIANNRYRWFGKRETCMLPEENLKAKFLS